MAEFDPYLADINEKRLDSLLGFVLQSGLPIARLSAQVHYGDNQDEVAFYRVQDTIGENAREAAPYVVLNYSPARRRFSDLPNRIFNGVDES